MGRLKTAWKYRRLIYKYRKYRVLYTHRQDIGAGALTAGALLVALLKPHR